MPEISHMDAPTHLGTLGVGVGENHEESGGRLFTLQLMQRGLVNALFLECHSNEQAALDAAMLRPSGVADYESVICASIRSWPMWKNFVHMACVAAVAGRLNIPVYLIDKDMGSRSKTKATALAERDTHAADLFNHATNHLPGGRRGCLILYGASHFTGGRYTYGIHSCLAERLKLNYVLSLPQVQTVQLSASFDVTKRFKHQQASIPPGELGAGRLP